MSFTPTNNIPTIPRKVWILLYILFLLFLWGMFIISFWPFGLLFGVVALPLVLFTIWKRHDE